VGVPRTTEELARRMAQISATLLDHELREFRPARKRGRLVARCRYCGAALYLDLHYQFGPAARERCPAGEFERHEP
jgi:hypothetical protein